MDQSPEPRKTLNPKGNAETERMIRNLDEHFWIIFDPEDQPFRPCGTPPLSRGSPEGEGVDQETSIYNTSSSFCMIRAIKEEVIWLEEFTSFSEVKETISRWIEQDYNQVYPHSALGYRSPVEFETVLHDQAKAA